MLFVVKVGQQTSHTEPVHHKGDDMSMRFYVGIFNFKQSTVNPGMFFPSG